MSGYPCTRCGQCCRDLLPLLLETKGEVPRSSVMGRMVHSFPYKLIEGRCEKLTGNQCSVYDDRPQVCRLDNWMGILDAEATIEQYYMETAQVCNMLIDNSGDLPEKDKDNYYIKLTDTIMLKCTGANCSIKQECMRHDPQAKDQARFEGNAELQDGCSHHIPQPDMANDDLGYSSTNIYYKRKDKNNGTHD